MASIRVVLDCDTANEVDDQFAIGHAPGGQRSEVRGVISVHNTTAPRHVPAGLEFRRGRRRRSYS